MKNIKTNLFLFALVLTSPLTAMAAAPTGQKSLLDLYKDGGPIMHFILLCSIATLSLGAYCGVMIRRKRMMPPAILTRLNHMMSQRDVAGAYQVCKANPGPMCNALSSALVKANFNRDMYNKTAMENAIADECFREETKLMVVVNYLNTFAVLAPMIGLLGTVSGMISSFSALTAGKAEAGDLAKGIGEALVATGGGLALAIPSMFLYFYFRGTLQAMMTDVHKKLAEMLDLFTGEVTAQTIEAVTGEHPAI